MPNKNNEAVGSGTLKEMEIIKLSKSMKAKNNRVQRTKKKARYRNGT